MQEQAEISVRFGADLYVTARQFGRNVPIPMSAAEEIRRIPGVLEVVPRIADRNAWMRLPVIRF